MRALALGVEQGPRYMWARSYVGGIDLDGQGLGSDEN